MEENSKILSKLYGLQKVGIKLGLERTQKLFENLGNPQNNLKFIHIAGTNGKGSVCSTIAKALENTGYKVGFYSSPHLISLRERFRINGKGIGWDELEQIIKDVWPVVKKMLNEQEFVTFFEVTVAVATIYFKKHNCDFVLWETGLGGRLDSTNIVTPIITAITGIGLDHESYLGDTEEKIAMEKAGIIKNNIPVFLGYMRKGPRTVIEQCAKNNNSQIFYAEDCSIDFKRQFHRNDILSGWEFIPAKLNKSYFLPLPGEVQPKNLKLAYQILKYLSEQYNFDFDKALTGISNLKWHGRIQLLPDGKVLDGAHNPQGIEEFISTIKKCYPDTKFTIIFGCLKDRNPYNALGALKEIAGKFIFTPLDSIRPCLSPDTIAETAENAAKGIRYEIASNSEQALNLAKNDKTVIVGSLYLAGENFKALLCS